MSEEPAGTEDPTGRLGTLEETDAGWRLRYVRSLGQSPATVWRAFADPALRGRWFPDSMSGELRAGAALAFDVTAYETESFGGTVLEVEEPHLLAFTWGPDVLRFQLAEVAGGTELTMTVELGELGRAARDGAGWHECLDQLAGLWPDSPRVETWADIHPVYVEHFGPEAAAIGPPQASSDAPP